MQALGDLARLFANLEADGAVYTHGRDVYLYLRPSTDLVDINRRSLLGFVLHIPTFQEWIDAQEQMVVTRAATQPASEWNALQQKAAKKLESIEAAVGKDLLAAYARWLANWATTKTVTYPISYRGQNPIELRIPPRVRVIPIVQPARNALPLHGTGMGVVRSVAPMFVIRTVTGRTLLVEQSNDAAHLRVGHEIHYSLAEREAADVLPLHEITLIGDP